MNTTREAPNQTHTIAAQDAPIGVQLWPTITAKYALNFTLQSVEIIRRTLRDASGTYDVATVEWTYESGATRTFGLDERVAVRSRPQVRHPNPGREAIGGR
jgi:hypothetical protein